MEKKTVLFVQILNTYIYFFTTPLFQALAELGLESVSDEDCSALRYVCECVSRRAGFMASAGQDSILLLLIFKKSFHVKGITALLKKMDYHDVVVAIDGSVYRYHPHFPNIMR